MVVLIVADRVTRIVADRVSQMMVLMIHLDQLFFLTDGYRLLYIALYDKVGLNDNDVYNQNGFYDVQKGNLQICGGFDV